MIKKILLGITSFALFTLFFSGCFQFRMSNQKAISYFEKKGISVEADQYPYKDRKMNYLHIPNASDQVPVVIYVHGSPGSSKDFFNTMLHKELHDSFELVTVDRPGYGQSNFGKGARKLDEQAGSIYPLLEKYSGRKIILVGHSYGGPVVCRIAMNYPDRISGLMIVAGSIDPDLEPKESWRKPLDRKWIRWMVPKAMVSSNQEIMALKGELEAIEKDWSKIQCATLVLQGTKDNLVPPGNADYAEKMVQNAPFKKIYRLDGINHFIPFNYEYFIVNALFELTAEI